MLKKFFLPFIMELRDAALPFRSIHSNDTINDVIARGAIVHESSWLTRHCHLPPATIPARYISIVSGITISRSRVCSRPGHNAIRISPVEEGEED